MRSWDRPMLLATMAATKPARTKAESGITHGLLIQKEWVDKIVAGTKTWEIRGKATQRRGPIALLESGSGHVVGTCELVDVVGPLSLRELRRHAREAGSAGSDLYCDTTCAWVLRRARRLRQPVPYRPPHGAVIWVRPGDEVGRRIDDARKTHSSSTR